MTKVEFRMIKQNEKGIQNNDNWLQSTMDHKQSTIILC